jgi:hypothetical protein
MQIRFELAGHLYPQYFEGKRSEWLKLREMLNIRSAERLSTSQFDQETNIYISENKAVNWALNPETNQPCNF